MRVPSSTSAARTTTATARPTISAIMAPCVLRTS
jgi:hypothetical protein